MNITVCNIIIIISNSFRIFITISLIYTLPIYAISLGKLLF